MDKYKWLKMMNEQCLLCKDKRKKITFIVKK